MKLQKLNAQGAIHIILPLLLIVGIGIIGSYVAVKSRSNADSLQATTSVDKASPSAGDDQSATVSKVVIAAEANELANESPVPGDTSLPTIGSKTMSANSSQAASSSASEAATCQHYGYDGYSGHYKKCINLRYNYSGDGYGGRTTTHNSKSYSFKSKFIITYKADCDSRPANEKNVPYTNLYFHSATTGDLWQSRYIQAEVVGGLTHKSGHIYSNSAQTLDKMTFKALNCGFTVNVWQ